ncbi:MAG: glycoside hydrolase family 15 protein [Acidobacteriota bacterium]
MNASEERYAPIGDYAIIGDCRSAALVRRTGSLDWLCLPRFDSPSLFAALLDADRGGRFAIRPRGDLRAERRYLAGTAVLETTMTTGTGVLRLLDAMPPGSEPLTRGAGPRPDHEVLRVVECMDGEVDVHVMCEPSPDYARSRPRFSNRGNLGIHYGHRAVSLTLRSEIPLQLGEAGTRAEGVERLRLGDRRRISLAFAHGMPAALPPLGEAADARLDACIRWWRDWTGQCPYHGPYRDAVMRSLITLKLLTYGPSGAVVAAPTTSLPESPGGPRNWDYRYCWLRDASLTLQALFDLGYAGEAEAFLSWLLHTTRMTRPSLQAVYDVNGEKRLHEVELDHLEGYRGSRPVRIGNGAVGQLQLDTYGELIDAVYEFVSRGGRLDRQTSRMLVGLGHTIVRRWREPDEGIWESRGGRRHHTYSKVMCWVALDRLVRLHEDGHLRAPVEKFRNERDAVREQVLTRGFHPELQSYVAELDGDDLDASLLLLSRYRFEDPDSPRLVSTYERIRDRLGRDGLIYRYLDRDDGLPGGEATFGICSFWAVEARARQGRIDDAVDGFEKLLSYANDVGLYAEEIDPETGAAMGNFPQAFTHVGLIDAALTIADRMNGDQRARSSRTGARV